MNKRLFIWLVILMGISLSGIVIVQFCWITNSVKAHNELFDRSVNEVLMKVALRIEFNQEVRIIDDGIPHNSLKDNGKITTQPKPGNLQGSEQAEADLNNRQKKSLEQLQLMTKRIEAESENWKTAPPIDGIKLEAMLKEELAARNIPTDFHYAIFSGDSIVQTDLKEPADGKWYKIYLFQDDIFRKNLSLGICFPGRISVPGGTMSLLQGLSGVFILIILIVFVMSISIIRRQNKLSEVKTDFINNITHEFKTPITTIGIAADSILNDEVIKNEEHVRFYGGMIRKENQRLNEQVERILQIAHLDRKELDFRFQTINIHELIEDAIQGISIQIEKRGGKIETRLDAKNPTITTDPVHFTNLVHNLLDNANKYSPDSPEILVSTANDRKGVYMTVEDKGIGMSKTVLSKIFDKYYRLAPGNINSIKGFGLGLSYIKKITEINKGNIKVYSEPGKGSRFVVFVPFSISQR